MAKRTLLIDLDGTVYSTGTGLWEEIGKRIEFYLSDVMSFDRNEIYEIRRSYFEKYGTTLRGLQIHHDIDPQDYLDFCHDVDVSQYIKIDETLQEMLENIPNPKYIFTNSDLKHAHRVLNAIGIREYFIDIIDIQRLDYECKPMAQAYQKAINIIGASDPSDYLFIDDSYRNVVAAIELGMQGILVSEAKSNVDGVPRINHLNELTTKYRDLLYT